MSAAQLLAELRTRGAKIAAVGGRLRVEAPAGTVTPQLLQTLADNKPRLLRLLLLDIIERNWKPGERLAYRDGGNLVTAKYAGTTVDGKVTLWLADGAVRAVPAETLALDWRPDAAEIFEERLCIMLAVGVPEEEARLRAEQCTQEYIDRLRGGAA